MTTPPKEHKAQVIPNLNMGSLKVTKPNTKMRVLFNFCVIKFLVKLQLRLQNPTGPPRLRGQGTGFQNTPSNFWEGCLHFLFYKVSDHGSRGTWCPGPSRTRFWVQKRWPHLKLGVSCIFCLIKILTNEWLRFKRHSRLSFGVQYFGGWGYRVETHPRTFPL